MMSDVMIKQIEKEKGESTNFRRETLVQGFHARQLLLLTPLVQFYIKNGLKIERVSKFIQYIPFKSLKTFADKITQMRIEADTNKNKTKGNTAKGSDIIKTFRCITFEIKILHSRNLS